MKKLLLFAAIGHLLADSAGAQTTGRGALRTLTREKGAAIASQAVLVSGEQGQDQPGSWRVVARDPEFAGRFLEYIVRKDKVVEAHPLTAQAVTGMSRAPLVAKRIKVDSTMAFTAADQAARKALIGFDSLDYELRNKELSQDPVWLVRLRDGAGTTAGELIISAESGAVLRKTWYEPGRPPAAAATLAASGQGTGNVGTPAREPAAAAAVGQKAQQLWDDTRTGLEQGKEVVKTGFQKASTNVRGWFGRLRGEPTGGGSSDWEIGTYDSSGRR